MPLAYGGLTGKPAARSTATSWLTACACLGFLIFANALIVVVLVGERNDAQPMTTITTNYN
jgi:hypothetical protein